MTSRRRQTNSDRRRPDRSEGPGQVGALGGSSIEHTELSNGVDYRVRSVSGSRSGGPYRCPGCDQVLAGSVPHIVAWPAHDLEAIERRHWHSQCWSARDRRRPGIERSRNAPRYG